MSLYYLVSRIFLDVLHFTLANNGNLFKSRFNNNPLTYRIIQLSTYYADLLGVRGQLIPNPSAVQKLQTGEAFGALIINEKGYI